MKKILVTGGAGFIGSECARQAVKRGDTVVVLDSLTYAGDEARLAAIKNNYTFYKGSITNVDLVQHVFTAEKPDVVIHWAAETHVDRSIVDASPFMDTNVKGTQILLDAAKQHGVERFINIATDEVYGELGEDGSFTEETPLAPNSPYAVSKTAADMLGRSYYRTYQLPVITVRPSNNYGPWQFPEKLLPVVVIKAMHDEKIPVYGQGLNVREWLHISDCVAGVLSIADNGTPGEIYNIGSGMEQRNIDVVKAILEYLGKSDDLIEFVKDRPGHDFRYSVATDKIRNQLDWKPTVAFENGLIDTVTWYVDNMGWVHEKLEFLRSYWNEAYKYHRTK